MSKILIVDDDPELLDLVQEQLEDYGHLVLKSAKPMEAIRLFQDTLPDLVIIDVIMQGMDGFDLLKQLKEITNNFKSILLSGVNDDKCRELAVQVGADLYLVKPIDPDKFKSAIESLLRRSTQ